MKIVEKMSVKDVEGIVWLVRSTGVERGVLTRHTGSLTHIHE